MSPKIAYLINQYPKVSHSFIRREILGIEACGLPVQRFAIRSLQAELVDDADRAELEKTRYILDVGLIGLAFALFSVAIAHPRAFFSTLALALRVGWGSERGLLLHFVYLAEACVLLGGCRQGGVTHVHSHFGTNSTTVAMFCESLGGPSYSFTVHGPEEFDKVKAIALPEKIRRAKFVVAISSFGKSQLYRWCSHDHWHKIHVVHCGVDHEFLNQPVMPIPEEPRLVCVGRLSEQKGHLLLLEAARHLAQKGEVFKLILVGDGELRTEIETFIAHHHLQNHIEITGWATNAEVRQQMLAARAFVLPSFAEGLPVVIMEALALGRPVISTYVAGIPELVEPGVCGWLVPAGSVEDLVEAMYKCLQSSCAELEYLGLAGHNRVAECHNIAIEAQKLSEIYRANV